MLELPDGRPEKKLPEWIGTTPAANESALCSMLSTNAELMQVEFRMPVKASRSTAPASRARQQAHRSTAWERAFAIEMRLKIRFILVGTNPVRDSVGSSGDPRYDDRENGRGGNA